MTLKTTNNIKAIILGLVLTVGMGYAAAATFNGPSCAPPNCNADAPITVGGNDVGITPYSQIKTGIVSLLHLITPDLTVTNSDGVTPVTVGQVLTATDTTGKVGWTTPAVATISSGMQSFTTSGTWVVPVGAKFAKLTVVGSGQRLAIGNSGTMCLGYGGVTQKIVSLSGLNSASIVIAQAATTVNIGSNTIIANSGTVSSGLGQCYNGTTSGGDFSGGYGPYMGIFGAWTGYGTNPVVLIEWY